MPVKRRAAKERRHRITQEAVEAYVARDFHRLHAALGLFPWELSPLPAETCGLGSIKGEPPAWMLEMPDRGADYRQAQELQRELEKATEAA